VPDGAVGVVPEGVGMGSVCLPALLRRRRLRHRRPDQRMPEPEPAMVDGPEPRIHRGRPRRVARKLGKLAVLERRQQKQAARIGVEAGEPRCERLLETRRQWEGVARRGSVKARRRARKLDQRERVSG
jgi:hypothetical protein